MLWGLPLAVAAVFAIAGIAPSAQARILVDRLEAAVQDQVILASDIRDFRRTRGLRAELDPLYSMSSLSKHEPSDLEILNYKIDDALVLQAAPVSDAMVKQEIQNILTNNHLTEAQLTAALEGRGFSYSDYFDFMRLGKSKRDLVEKEVRSRVSVTDDDVRQEIYNTRKEQLSRYSFHLGLIRVSPARYRTPEAAAEVAQRALGEIQGGQAFAEVAKRVSDHESNSTGGDLGFLRERDILPQLHDHVLRMRAGELSTVLGDAKSGYFVLRLEEVREEADENFTKIKEAVRNELYVRDIATQFSITVKRLRSSGPILITSEKTQIAPPGAPNAAPKP